MLEKSCKDNNRSYGSIRFKISIQKTLTSRNSNTLNPKDP